MKYKREKLIKIMNELVNFCLHINMSELIINFKSDKDWGEVSVEGYCANPPMDRLENLEYILNSPRQPELEGYYWNLLGDGHGRQELEMVGTLVDSGSISYEDNILKISVKRDQRH
ncbi:MAG TPA: hypothetical protein VFC60_00475 [Tissierellaceae bacterium]|nr:hypothetical protein [Tissierellaceae bacterium]